MFVSLGRPKELDSARVEDLSGGSLGKHGANGVAILLVSQADNGPRTGLIVLVDIEHQFGEEGIILHRRLILGCGSRGSAVNGELVHEVGGIAIGFLGSNFLFLLDVLTVGNRGKVFVGGIEEADSFSIIIGLPELQLGSTLEELADTFGLLHTGKLDKNTLGSAKLLDGRLSNAELIDTLADNLIGALIGVGSFRLNSFDNILVLVTHLDFVAEVAADEVRSQRDIAVEGGNLLVEEGDEIAVGGHLLLRQGIVDSLVEEGILGITGEGANHVDGRDLKHDVHTALQVKTEVNLATLALTVGVAEVDLFGGH